MAFAPSEGGGLAHRSGRVVLSDQTNQHGYGNAYGIAARKAAVAAAAFPLISPAVGSVHPPSQQPQGLGFAPTAEVLAHSTVAYAQRAIRSREVPDPVEVPEYAAEIREYFLVLERTHLRDGVYLLRQREITERMRMIVVDWLVDVIIRFKLRPETFYLAVDIMDRYLALKEMSCKRIQLLAITGVLLAAKYEEIWPPEVKDCTFICANAYTAEEVIALEQDIVVTLRFKLTVPTVYPLLTHFLNACAESPVVRDACFLFLECATACYGMLNYLPSRVAAASLFLGRLTTAYNEGTEEQVDALSPAAVWDRELVHVTRGILLPELLPITKQLLEFARELVNPTFKYDAVRRKYSSPSRNRVATLAMPPIDLLMGSAAMSSMSSDHSSC